MRFRSLVASAWTLAILMICWLPRTYMPVNEGAAKPFLFPNFDKVIHFGIFGVFAFLWMWAVATNSFRGRKVFLGGLLLAVISEFGQEMPFVHRDADFFDGLANMVGVVAGILFYRLLLRFETRPAV